MSPSQAIWIRVKQTDRQMIPLTYTIPERLIHNRTDSYSLSIWIRNYIWIGSIPAARGLLLAPGFSLGQYTLCFHPLVLYSVQTGGPSLSRLQTDCGSIRLVCRAGQNWRAGRMAGGRVGRLLSKQDAHPLLV